MRELLEALRHPAALLGFAGQFAFLVRFVVQWIASERERRSVIPTIFWHFSIAGALLLLVYAWIRKDPVFLFGQVAAMAIYVRNLVLVRRHARPESP
jgi:lipid-A-disaccharide synthase-like uncharacterized protein